jgi:transcription initiation factor IIF auxiliary subunit
MIDFANIALRTLMCLAFLAFVVRPMLMSMVRREPNTLELEEMAQLAIDSAFKEQFSTFYTPRSTPKLEAPTVIDVETVEVVEHQLGELAPEPVQLSEEELAALAQFKAEEEERVRGHEEELARRAALAAEEAERLAQLEAERATAGEADDEGDDTDDSLTKMRESMKKEKKKPTIPAELLAGNSYEDKLMIVRLVTEQEQNRVANAIRSMIQIQP